MGRVDLGFRVLVGNLNTLIFFTFPPNFCHSYLVIFQSGEERKKIGGKVTKILVQLTNFGYLRKPDFWILLSTHY